jgi:hypothetical protein
MIMMLALLTTVILLMAVSMPKMYTAKIIILVKPQDVILNEDVSMKTTLKDVIMMICVSLIAAMMRSVVLVPPSSVMITMLVLKTLAIPIPDVSTLLENSILLINVLNTIVMMRLDSP